MTPHYVLGGTLISLAPDVPISLFVTWNLVLPWQGGRKSLGSLFAAVRVMRERVVIKWRFRNRCEARFRS